MELGKAGHPPSWYRSPYLGEIRKNLLPAQDLVAKKKNKKQTPAAVRQQQS
ncbi:hypothetical protein [Methanoregula sp. UBA64]|jgi:hypothetical protein|uniref:hypothetical protein n=1 Tax=Methanoregula sp. UBA64 TaxID=1915554 RepID=UPI0026012FC7|nr:hypothetical protein [Methanoregula sp. UBA64]